jgi:hypothetical protein
LFLSKEFSMSTTVRSLLGVTCRALAASVALTLTASAQTFSSTVGLDGAQEVPPVATTGTGSATVTVDAVTRAVTVSGTYSGLVSNQTIAHIHVGPFGVAGGIALDLVGTGGTAGTITGSGTFSVSEFNAFKAGNTYINVHSVMFGAGEIRGQIVNLTGSTELPGDPTLADNAGDPIRGPRIADATERFNVALDCSGAGASGTYAILIHSGTLTPPSTTAFGRVWLGGIKLVTATGAHAQNVVTFAPGTGIVLPNSPSLVGVAYTVQGFCSDSTNPPGRLSQALVQVIEM